MTTRKESFFFRQRGRKNNDLGKRRWKGSTRVYVPVLASVLVFSAAVFMYEDITNTIDDANILLKALAHGRILDFYELSVEQSATFFSANYNFIVYIVFALWQAPFYLLLSKGLGQDYLMTPWAMLWSKMLILLFAAFVACLIFKIVVLCTERNERAWLAVFLYYSSMTVFFPVFICGQIDAIAMTFILLGLFWYLKDDMVKFWACFFIAAPFKMFALILALPLVLGKQKNIPKALAIWISMTGIIFIERFVFRHSAIYKYALGSQSRDAIQEILSSGISVGKSFVIFLFCYFCALTAALMKRLDRKEILYLCFWIWGTFTAFSKINSYWIYYVAPFMIMSICVNDRYLSVTTMIESIGSFCYVLYLCLSSYVFEYTGLVKNLFLPFLVDIPEADRLKYASIKQLFLVKEWNQYSALFTTVFISSIIIVLILSFPRHSADAVDVLPLGENAEGDVTVSEPYPWLPYVRILLIMGMAAMIVYAYTAGSNPVSFDTTGFESAVGEADLLSEGQEYVITQSFVMQDDRQLDELILKFSNNQPYRHNMALLTIEIWETDQNVCIFSEKVGCSYIGDNKELRIGLNSMQVSRNKEYQIRLYGKPGVKSHRNWTHLYPYFTEQEESPLPSAEINGEKVDQYLYFRIR